MGMHHGGMDGVSVQWFRKVGIRRGLVVGVLLLVLVSGCLGGNGSSEVNAPGVTSEGIQDTQQLFNAHRNIVLDRGAVIQIDRVVRNQSGEIDQNTTQRLEVGPNATRVSASGSGEGLTNEQQNVLVWLNDTASIYQSSTNNSTTYQVLEPAQTRENLIWGGNIRSYLNVAQNNFSVTNRQTSGDNRTITLQANVDLLNNTAGEETSMELIVEGSGLIRSFRVNQTFPEGQTFILEYSVNELGIDPATPDWVAGVPQSAFLDINIQTELRNESIIVLNNTGSDAVPTNSTVTVTTQNASLETQTPSPIEPGGLRYAYINQEGELVITETEPMENETSGLGTRVLITVDTEDGVRLATSELAVRRSPRQPIQP